MADRPARLVQLGRAAGRPCPGLGGQGGLHGKGRPIELTTAALVEGLEATHGQVGRLLAGLPPDAWDRDVPATPAWSVGDVVAHLAEGDRAALAAAQGRPSPGLGPGASIDAWASAGVAAHDGSAPEARLEAWEAAADAFRWQLAAMDGAGWRGRVPWLVGSISVRALGVLRLNDAWLHGHDLAEAVGRPFPADELVLAFMADLAARTVPGGLSRRGRARPGAVILLRLGDTGEWLLGGAAGERPDPAAEPDLVLEADPLPFVLRAAGRVSGEPWRATGDRSLAADLAATLSSVS